MGINLQKGQKISLSKEAPNLSKVIMGLGWDVRKNTQQKSGGFLSGMFGGGSAGANFDLDAACVMLNENNKVYDFVYFGNLKSRCNSVIHTGDNLTGDGDGDDEQIIVELNRVPQDVKKLIFLVTIYQAQSRKQDFGMVENAFVRMVNTNNNAEIAKYNLSENYPGKTTMVLAEIYRHNNEWKMGAIGEGTTDGSLSEAINKYK